MITGEYVLELSCDQKEGCATTGYFTYSSRMLARDMAREAGWLLNRWNKCWCPEHAIQRRAKWT